MKKILLTLILLALIVPASFAQFTKIGASLGYNYRYYFNDEQFDDHKLKNPILSFNAVYELSLPVHIVPKLNVYFPNVVKTDMVDFQYQTTTWGLSFDLDGHYVFNSLDKMELYGLAGLNILYAKRKFIEEYPGNPDYVDKSSNTELGLNLGAGAYWKVKDEFDLFMEAKVILAKQIQAVVSVGIFLNMEYLWTKEKESGY